MDDNETKALHFLKEAEKKAKPGGGFFGLFGGKSEDVCELYVKAANLFKIAKKWDQAGKAFVKSAENNLHKGDAKHEAASNYVDAATCFRKADLRAAVDCLIKSAEIYTDMGRFSMAAKNHMTAAELYEVDLSDLDQAIYHYEKAADYYRGEESKRAHGTIFTRDYLLLYSCKSFNMSVILTLLRNPTSDLALLLRTAQHYYHTVFSAANKCLLKVAQFAAQLQQYRKAIDIYEEVAKAAIDSSLLKYSAKDYFFKSLLCYLCVDLLDAQQALKRYDDLYPSFTDTREHKLINNCMLALETENADEFTNAVREYDKISRLDQWTTTMLLRVKKKCGEEEGGDGSDLL